MLFVQFMNPSFYYFSLYNHFEKKSPGYILYLDINYIYLCWYSYSRWKKYNCFIAWRTVCITFFINYWRPLQYCWHFNLKCIIESLITHVTLGSGIVELKNMLELSKFHEAILHRLEILCSFVMNIKQSLSYPQKAFTNTI